MNKKDKPILHHHEAVMVENVIGHLKKVEDPEVENGRTNSS